jgi:glycine betaine/proline transport system substrate-binding protein
MRFLLPVIACLALAGAPPAQAQLTVLDQAQDQGNTSPQAPPDSIAVPLPPPCGVQPMTVARMSWPSAALLAEIHVRLLTAELGCEARVIPGDLAATTSSMASTGQPAVAPEMWASRIADVWNGAVEAERVRAAAPTFADMTAEGWFVPAYMAPAFGEGASVGSLGAVLTAGAARVRFISCPADWACSIINKNLIAAHGLADLVELVEPANRFEMDALIAEAVSRRENFIFYYWQPNAVLAQLDFRLLDMGAYDEEAMKCLALVTCVAPKVSAFAPETVVAALSEWVFTEAPTVASYLQRASIPVAEMNRLLAELGEPGASVEDVAERFVRDNEAIWGPWLGRVQ